MVPTPMSVPAGFNINRDSASPSTGIIRRNPFPIPIYDHLVVAAISPPLLPPPGHYQFQYQGAILRPSILDEDMSSLFAKSRVDKAAALSPSAPNSKGTQSTTVDQNRRRH
jgi:hypothetical protein